MLALTLAMLALGALLGVGAGFGVDHLRHDGHKTTGPVTHVRTGAVARRAAAPRVASTHSTTQAVSAPGLAAVRGKTVAIDPGHNAGNWRHLAEVNRIVDAGTLRKPCDNTGTETDRGYLEANYTMDVALRLARILRAAGARVVLTREPSTPWGPCITERAAIANRAHATVAISIHADGGPAAGHGFHVIYPPSIRGLTDDIAAASYRLAVDVRAAYAAGTGMPFSTYAGTQALVVRRDLGGLNLSDVPKVFVETGNMRNAQDAALLVDPKFRERAARSLANGLARFLAGH